MLEILYLSELDICSGLFYYLTQDYPKALKKHILQQILHKSSHLQQVVFCSTTPVFQLLIKLSLDDL